MPCQRISVEVRSVTSGQRINECSTARVVAGRPRPVSVATNGVASFCRNAIDTDRSSPGSGVRIR